MKRSWVILFGCWIILTGWRHPVAAVPRPLDDFKQAVTREASDPRKAAQLWVEASLAATEDEVRGEEMLQALYYQPRIRTPLNRTFFERLKSQPHIFRSYVKGTSPANGYKVPDPDKIEIEVTRLDEKPFADRPAGAFVKVFIRSSGADNPRPITFQRMPDGIYRVYEFSSLYLGVRPPQ